MPCAIAERGCPPHARAGLPTRGEPKEGRDVRSPAGLGGPGRGAALVQAPGCRLQGARRQGGFQDRLKGIFHFFVPEFARRACPGPVHWGRRRAQGGGESRYERRGEKVRREGSSRRRALEMVGCRLPAFRRATLPTNGAHGVMGLLPTKYLQTLFSAAFQIKRPKGSALCLWLRLRTATPTVSRSTSRPV